MKLKCMCVLFYDIARFKKGSYETTNKIITVRPSLFEKISVAVPEGIKAYGYKKDKLLFLIDVKHLLAVSWEQCFAGTISEKTLQDFASKFGLMSRDKTWKFLGARGMDIVEMLITMGAGYGFFRLVEVMLMQLHI